MPPERRIPGSAGDWLRFARSDLLLAKMWNEDLLLEPLCFHAQQAAEKALAQYVPYIQAYFPNEDRLTAAFEIENAGAAPILVPTPEGAVAAWIALVDGGLNARRMRFHGVGSP